MIIYSCFLPTTGKRYIGKTVKPLLKRWNEHCYTAKTPKTRFHCSIKSHGSQDWVVEIVEEVKTLEDLNEREKYWIKYYDTYNSGYNMTEGGDGGAGLNPEVATKIASSLRGYKQTQEHKDNVSKSLKGRKKPPRSKDHTRKIVEAAAKTRTGKKRGPYKGKTSYSKGYKGINP